MDRQERNGNERGESNAYAEGYLIACLAAEQECHAEQDEINEQQRPEHLKCARPEYPSASIILIP